MLTLGNRPSARTLCLHYPHPLPKERFEAFAETCLEFTPQLALRETNSVFIEFSGSLNLFSEESLPIKVREKALRFGIPHPRIAIADDPGTALALAKHSITGVTSATLTVPRGTPRLETLAALPLEALHDLTHPFFDPEEAKDLQGRDRIARVLELLRKLGLRTLEDFARLPARQLPARFGREGAELSLQLRNPLPTLWPVWAPPEFIQERFEIDSADPLTLSGCGDLGGLLEALKIPLERACERLRVRGLKAARLKITLTPDIDTPREWSFALPVPQGSTGSILPLIRDRMDAELQRQPFESTISTLDLTVDETAPGGGAQRDFFSKKEEATEAWEGLLGRLTLRLGESNVYRASLENSHRPEEAWSRQSRPDPNYINSLSPVSTGTSLRPTKLLQEPLELRTHTDHQGKAWLYPAAPNVPAVFKRNWMVQRKTGPERITGEWWKRDSLLARDYYRIETQNPAEVLWVFMTPDRKFYLHGFF